MIWGENVIRPAYSDRILWNVNLETARVYWAWQPKKQTNKQTIAIGICIFLQIILLIKYYNW